MRCFFALVAILGLVIFWEGSVLAEPTVLGDEQLDVITAGHTTVNDGVEEGGIIVANGSEAKLTTQGSVNLNGAQQEARALNLVNAADSAVANGVNIWDGRQTGEGFREADQTNTLLQTQALRSASLPEYEREDANIATSFTSTFSLVTSRRDNFTNDSMVDTRQAVTVTGGPSEMPRPDIEVKAGQGISGTGTLGIQVDAGSINIGLSAGATTSTATRLGSNTTSANFSTNLRWDLPKLDVNFDGGICYVQLGVCSAKGSRDFFSSLDESRTEDYAKAVWAPISLAHAKAEYIVVDQSKLEVENNFSVIMSGTAQQNARALNLVNAAGSLVANGVNVSRTATTNHAYRLSQSNLIIQRR